MPAVRRFPNCRSRNLQTGSACLVGGQGGWYALGMQGFWRYPAVPVGATLLVLGIGNCVVSRTKIAEYEQRIEIVQPVDVHAPLQDFERLSPRTNSRVLDGLHRGPGAAGVVEAKRDFYAVVESGGRLIAILGSLLIGAGATQHWRHRRFATAPEAV
jgi:hypothetical protein